MSPARLARAVVVLLAASCVPASWAQLPTSNSTTATPIPGAGHNYLGGLSETVNPATGAISIRIPVVVPPGRGITLPFAFAYDSGGVNFVSQSGISNAFPEWYTTGLVLDSSPPPFSQGGWSAPVPQFSDHIITWTTTADPGGGGKQIPCEAVVNFVYQDASGNRHNLGLTNYSDPGGTGPCTINSNNWPPGFSGEVVTTGGEGSLVAYLPSTWSGAVEGQVTVIDGDGNSYSSQGLTNHSWPAGFVADRNGNGISINTSSAPAFSYTDTAGRTAIQDSGFAVTPETLTVSGLGAPYTVNWTTLATPSFSTGTTVLYGTACGSLTHAPWTSSTDHAVSSIELPNGQSFTFSYDTIYGLVNKMTYPSWSAPLNSQGGVYDSSE